MRIDLSNIETLSLQYYLNYDIKSWKRARNTENNFTLALRELENAEEKDRKQLFNEIAGVMEEFDFTQKKIIIPLHVMLERPK